MAYIPNSFRPDPKPEKIIKPKKAFTYKRKPTGELELFKKLFDERNSSSEITGEYLGEFNVSYMAHILPKGKNKYPHFKLNSENICIMNLMQHNNWDGMRSKCNGPEWASLYKKESELKKLYSELYPSK